jgi:hypothetical protein
MKPITQRILLAFFAIGLSSSLVAEQRREYAEVSFCVPGGSKHPIARDQFVTLIIDGPVLMYESNAIPDAEVVSYVNELLQGKNVSYLGVYIREGTTYGDVIRTIDTLRKTNTKSIGVSVSSVPVSRKSS